MPSTRPCPCASCLALHTAPLSILHHALRHMCVPCLWRWVQPLGVMCIDERVTLLRAQGMMKACHPDRNNVEANEFCALLNEIYEVGRDV